MKKILLELHTQEDGVPIAVSVDAIMAFATDEDGAAIRMIDGETIVFVSEDYKAIKAELVGTEEVNFINFA